MTLLAGRLVDQVGAPLSGRVTVAPRGGGDPVSVLLDGAGRFSAEAVSAAGYDVVDSSGRSWTVDVSSARPTVLSEAAPGGPRLDLSYVGAPDMQGQTAESLAAQARSSAVDAQRVASAAAAQAATFAGALAMMSASMQAALTAAQTATGRRVGLVVGRAAVPAVAANADRTLPVAWSAPAVPSSAVALLEPTGSVLGQVSVTVRADSVAASGCDVVLRSPVLVAAGAGSVAVVAAYLM